jgi:hypothetical protein
MRKLFYLGTMLGSSLDTNGSTNRTESEEPTQNSQDSSTADGPVRGSGQSAVKSKLSRKTDGADGPEALGGLSARQRSTRSTAKTDLLAEEAKSRTVRGLPADSPRVNTGSRRSTEERSSCTASQDQARTVRHL